MNPPFTNNKLRGRQYGKAIVEQMQQHELGILGRLAQRDRQAVNAVNSNSVGTFFTPLADRLLGRRRGTIAKVAPATACTNASGAGERRFLAERFHIERIVTSHDPRRINFSENTGIHECLIVLRRWPDRDRPATEFVSLRRMPATADEAIAAADAIAAGGATEWGEICNWPADRVRSGDWTPVQWFDAALADMARNLETNAYLEPVGFRYRIGPAGQGVLGAYEVCKQGTPGAVPGFHSVSSKIRRTMRGEPDVWYRPRKGKERPAGRYLEQRSCLLVPMRFNTMSARLTGLWTPQPSFGWWVPVAVDDDTVAKALAAWWNSTPVRLMLLNRRGKTLTYPTWQLAHLREIRIPKPDNPAWGALKEAFDAVCDEELLPMKQAEDCAVRRVIDEAAARALGLDPEVLADWRRRLAAEPTVSNRPAPGPEPA